MLKHKLKQLLKRTLAVTGLYQILWKFIPNGVYVFNYHRIGNKNLCLFDREVYSCTTDAFEEQCLFIKNNFTVISLNKLDDLLKSGEDKNTKYALITFDDGYIDNYSEAFPLLKKHNIPATFYVATDFVSSNLIPWWDEIAFLLRNSQGESYQLPNHQQIFHLTPDTLESVINRIIYEAKRLVDVTVLDVLKDVRKTFPRAVALFQDTNHELFMNWQQLNEMSLNGMMIGSHTLSHQVLSQLSEDDQKQELGESKHIIEHHLNQATESVVYPVGRMHCYTEETCKFAELAGYHFAFNNEPGRITQISNRYDLNRFCIGSNELRELKLNVLLHL